MTNELMQQSLKTSHDGCQKECKHAQLIIDNEKAIIDILVNLLFNPITHINPPLAIFAYGMHVGYRLHQLENESTAKEVAN